MIIKGVDFHPEFQEIASVDTDTGEYQEPASRFVRAESFLTWSVTGNESQAISLGIEQRTETIPFEFKTQPGSKMALVHGTAAEAGTAGETLNSIAAPVRYIRTAIAKQ
jgi:hypothetical protein